MGDGADIVHEDVGSDTLKVEEDAVEDVECELCCCGGTCDFGEVH